MRRNKLEKYISNKGYNKGGQGYYYKGNIRCAVQRTDVRIEKKVLFGWIRIFNACYKNIEIDTDGKLRRKNEES